MNRHRAAGVGFAYAVDADLIRLTLQDSDVARPCCEIARVDGARVSIVADNETSNTVSAGTCIILSAGVVVVAGDSVGEGCALTRIRHAGVSRASVAIFALGIGVAASDDEDALALVRYAGVSRAGVAVFAGGVACAA